MTISESKSETFTQTVRGDEGWTFANETLTRTGAALALDATTFENR